MSSLKSDYENRQAAKAAKKKNSKSLGALGGLAVHSLDRRGFDMSSKTHRLCIPAVLLLATGCRNECTIRRR